MIMGLVVHSVWNVRAPFALPPNIWRWGLPILLACWLLCPFIVSGYAPFWRRLAEMPAKQRAFDAEVVFLKDQPGPAICESLLRCYDANKPYVYDPFNTNRLLLFNKLDAAGLLIAIRKHRYGAIQLHAPVESFKRPSDRFPDTILDAIARYYLLSVQDPDCVIYVPRSDGSGQIPPAIANAVSPSK
jgi:hypothetical protein